MIRISRGQGSGDTKSIHTLGSPLNIPKQQWVHPIYLLAKVLCLQYCLQETLLKYLFLFKRGESDFRKRKSLKTFFHHSLGPRRSLTLESLILNLPKNVCLYWNKSDVRHFLLSFWENVRQTLNRVSSPHFVFFWNHWARNQQAEHKSSISRWWMMTLDLKGVYINSRKMSS